MCCDIAALRRKLQRIPNSHLLFLDETAVRISEAPTRTLVLPGETAYVLADDTSRYAPRFDMIACCCGDRVFPPIIYAPNERQRGINQHMLLKYIRNILAQAAGALDRYPLTLVLDRATIHDVDKIKQEFNDWGCQELAQVLLMPTQAAKRMSPLDNALFHDWKEAVRKRCPLTKRTIKQVMADEWNNIQPSKIAAHYKQCGLTRATDVYADCPAPASHAHAD